MRSLLLDREGRLWVAGEAGTQRWLGDGRFSAPLGPANATRLFQDSRGRIWIGSSRAGAAVYDPASGALRTLAGLGHFWIYSIAEALPGEIWLGTFGKGIDVWTAPAWPWWTGCNTTAPTPPPSAATASRHAGRPLRPGLDRQLGRRPGAPRSRRARLPQAAP